MMNTNINMESMVNPCPWSLYRSTYSLQKNPHFIGTQNDLERTAMKRTESKYRSSILSRCISPLKQNDENGNFKGESLSPHEKIENPRPDNARSRCRCNSPVSSWSKSVELSAKIHQGSAAISRPSCIWSGTINQSHHLKAPVYSCKVFLGGVPWDITEVGLRLNFAKFGDLNVERPKKIGIAGHLYLEFKNEASVHYLLEDCRKDNGNYFYKVSSEEKPCKEVQVIPWVLSDAEKLYQPVNLDNYPYTVYVGALHGMMTAEFLGDVMSDIFGDVVYAGIDTDKCNKYPIGSGRVIFTTSQSFMKAVEAEFVEIRTQKFTKKIQIEPYLVESICGQCEKNLGNLFCRDLSCFEYFCSRCWYIHHSQASRAMHQPISRKCQ